MVCWWVGGPRQSYRCAWANRNSTSGSTRFGRHYTTDKTITARCAWKLRADLVTTIGGDTVVKLHCPDPSIQIIGTCIGVVGWGSTANGASGPVAACVVYHTCRALCLQFDLYFECEVRVRNGGTNETAYVLQLHCGTRVVGNGHDHPDVRGPIGISRSVGRIIIGCAGKVCNTSIQVSRGGSKESHIVKCAGRCRGHIGFEHCHRVGYSPCGAGRPVGIGIGVCIAIGESNGPCLSTGCGYYSSCWISYRGLSYRCCSVNNR
jgi:hypothetical protein